MDNSEFSEKAFDRIRTINEKRFLKRLNELHLEPNKNCKRCLARGYSGWHGTVAIPCKCLKRVK
jgi:hypothetical protein